MRTRGLTRGTAVVVALASQLLVGGAAGATGSGWSIEPSPNPAGATSSTLAAVSCPGPATCMAVGQYTPAGGGILTLAERWDGSSWNIESTPNRAAASNVLTGVSCASPGSCTAVGYSVSSMVRALVEEWDGNTWTIVPTPAPPHSSWFALFGVSCPAPSDCTAVGGSIGKAVDAQEKPLAEHWDGTAWTIEPTPNPRAQNGSDLSGVACPGPAVCEAVGNYAYADVDQSVFAFGWNGTSWVHQHQPNPAGANMNSDNFVSCSSAAACTSIGTWTDAGQRIRGLAERWNGTSWSRQLVANPKAFTLYELFGVSCANGSSCTAVGDWSTSFNGNPSATLAEEWDGTAWSIDSTPNPNGATASTPRGSPRSPRRSRSRVAGWCATR